MRKNNDIRLIAFEKGIRLWEVAEKMKIHYATFNSLLRKDLTEEKRKEILNYIKELEEEKKDE